MKTPSALSLLRAMACCALGLMLASRGAAAEEADATEHLIVNNQWRTAARAIFLEVRRSSPHTYSLTGNQAEAGFIEDALATAQEEFPVSRVPLIFQIIKRAPALSTSKRKSLMGMALDFARAGMGYKYPNSIRSGDLAQVSLGYLELGEESQAQTIYDEALSVAEMGFRDAGNRGYRPISEKLATIELKLVRPWMVPPLLQRIDRAPTPFDAAVTYLDLARLASRQNQRDQAMDLLNLGMNAAKKIESAGLRQAPVDALTRFAVEIDAYEFAERFGNRGQLLPSYAVRAAAKGQREAALTLVSALPNTMYLGYGWETQAKIISDATKRRDPSAIFYAERLGDCPTSLRMNAWTQIAEFQAAIGEKTAAQASYSKARDAINMNRENEYSSLEVLATLKLGESMIHNGFKHDGHSVLLSAVQQSRLIPGRRVDDRISVATAIARSLNSAGEVTEARAQLLQAYRAVRSYPKDRNLAKMHQAELLSEIGLVAAKMATPRTK